MIFERLQIKEPKYFTYLTTKTSLIQLDDS